LKTSSACCLVAPAGIGAAPGCWAEGAACTEVILMIEGVTALSYLQPNDIPRSYQLQKAHVEKTISLSYWMGGARVVRCAGDCRVSPKKKKSRGRENPRKVRTTRIASSKVEPGKSEGSRQEEQCHVVRAR
jgi:hypothetical protein